MSREKTNRRRTGHGLNRADAVGKVRVTVAALKRTALSAAGTAPAEVAIARSKASPAAGTAPAALVVSRSRAPAAGDTASVVVAVDPERRSSRRCRRSTCRPRGGIRVGITGKKSISVDGGRNIFLTVRVGPRLLIAWRAKGGYGSAASAEVAQVRGASGWKSAILDQIAKRKTDGCTQTRYRFRIFCEGRPIESVAGYQTDAESSSGIRQSCIRRGKRSTMASLSPYPQPLAHAHRHILRRPPAAGASPSVFPLLQRSVPTPTAANARVLLLLRLLLSALVAVSPALSTILVSLSCLFHHLRSLTRPVGSNESVFRLGPFLLSRHLHLPVST